MYTVHKIASWGMSLYFLSKVVSVTKINTPIRLEVLNICKMSPSDCKTQYTPYMYQVSTNSRSLKKINNYDTSMIKAN